MPSITFTDSKGTARTVEAEVGSTVMEVAIRNRVPEIVAECGGRLRLRDLPRLRR